MKLMKRVFAFALMLCLLILCVCPTTAMAAPNYKGKTQKFYIRWSDDYSKAGVTVIMKSTSVDGKTGTITFNGKIKMPVSVLYGSYKTIPSGAVYDYKISSLKEGGTITLTIDVDASRGKVPADSTLYKIVGKIHVDKAKGCCIANIWKIDTLRFENNSPLKKLNVYFRNN